MAQSNNDEENDHRINVTDEEGTTNSTDVTSQVLPLSAGTRNFQFEAAPQFRLVRLLLRVLSLWCPATACCVERFAYPLVVNFLLLSLSLEPIWDNEYQYRTYNIVRGLLCIILNMNSWLSHTAGVIYFRSRDLEENMTNFSLCEDDAKRYRNQMIFYNIRTAVSLLVIPLYSFGMVVTGLSIFIFKNDVYRRWPAIVYIPGMYVSILWIVDLFHVTSNARLIKQHVKFVHWKKSVDDAILDHSKNYGDKVHRSCRGLHRWFQIHNFFLSLILPAFIFEKLSERNPITNPIAIVGGLVIILIIIWALPFYFANEIEKNDKHFRCRVNAFCSHVLMAVATHEDAVDNEDQDESPQNPPQNITFALRSNVESFLFYLEHVKSGFQVVGFSTQLTASLISLFISIFTLAIHVVSKFKHQYR